MEDLSVERATTLLRKGADIHVRAESTTDSPQTGVPDNKRYCEKCGRIQLKQSSRTSKCSFAASSLVIEHASDPQDLVEEEHQVRCGQLLHSFGRICTCISFLVAHSPSSFFG